MRKEYQESSIFEVMPNWLALSLCGCFSVLYSIWMLPGTIALRNICLALGVLASIFPIYRARHLLLTKKAISAWLILALFMWATFHLFILAQNLNLQQDEFSSIWKRTALGAIFAFGFGLALTNQDFSQRKFCWLIFYLGLLTPSLIYLLKYMLMYLGSNLSFAVPAYLKLYYSSAPFYIPKTAYVCFCMPALAVALGELRRNIANHNWLGLPNIVYAFTVLLVFFIFYIENIKNGVIYSIFLILVFLILLLKIDFKKHWKQKILLIVVISSVCSIFLSSHIQKNDSWRTLASDAKVAFNTDQYDQWKFGGIHGYPINELGKMVSITNYERIAWGKVGVILLSQNPLGYGLVERAFGHLSKQIWPDSRLSQSHSGWLDLAMGIGLPGIVIILGALTLIMWQLQQILKSRAGVQDKVNSLTPWLTAVWWILLVSLVMWCTTEISQKVYFDSLIFWLAFGSGLLLGLNNRLLRV